ncbi:TPA: hypothetical protein ACG5W5_005377, partial [Escherichia coli]
KTPSVAFWRKKRKKTRNTRPNQKNAPESFLEGCITMHESDARSISTVPKGEQVKMTSFLALGGKFCTGIFCFRASRFARTKKTDLGSGQESESVRNFF